jgi:hypothetical protein
LRDGSLVVDALARVGGAPEIEAAWRDLLAQPLVGDDDTDEGY